MIAIPVFCSNDQCAQYRKSGKRRMIGEAQGGGKWQCRICNQWTAV